MVSDPSMARRRRRRLSPSEKYEIYVGLLTGQFTQREAADRHGVDRSTVVHIVRRPSRVRWTRWRPRCRVGRGRARRPRPWQGRARRSSGCGPRSPSRRWCCICTREKRVGTERRPGPAQGGRDGQGRPARPGRRRRRCRLVDPARGAAARPGFGPGATVGPAARNRGAGRSASRWRRARDPARRAGGDLDPRRDLGAGRSLPPQVGPPRFPARAGARLRVHRAAGPGRRRPCPTRQAGP